MKALIIKFTEAKTNQEVNNLVNENLEILNENPKLFIFAKNARKRINRIRREKAKSWKLYEMN
jgi:hypothetical protein